MVGISFVQPFYVCKFKKKFTKLNLELKQYELVLFIMKM